jgi:hypothetical protein
MREPKKAKANKYIWSWLSQARSAPHQLPSFLPCPTPRRTRSHQDSECAASECSLMCDDLQRLGYQDVLVDPSVRVAYTAEVGSQAVVACASCRHMPASLCPRAAHVSLCACTCGPGSTA